MAGFSWDPFGRLLRLVFGDQASLKTEENPQKRDQEYMVLAMPAETYHAVNRLALISGSTMDKFAQDSFRTAEWFMWQESQGKRAISVSDKALSVLRAQMESGALLPADCEIPDSYIATGQEENARRYFSEIEEEKPETTTPTRQPEFGL